ncbi:MAG: hypothetical protein AB9872_00855 [Solidesulfovibrio sp.]
MEADLLAIVSGVWPEAMERGRVSDATFAAAYARVSDRHRAWIKTGLAAMYAANGGPWPLCRREATSLGHDLMLDRLETPLDYALIVCGREFVSPVRLAATVIPALCARVPDIAVVRVGERWPHVLLTALELCGVETVCRVGVRSMPDLWAALPAKGRGVVVLLGDVAAPAGLPSDLRLLKARVSGRAGVFPGAEADFDREALAFAHPDMTFFVHDDPRPGQPPFASAQGDLAAATDLGYDAVYAGDAHLRAAQKAAPLALGPGRETFWLWPDISASTFRQQRLTAAVENRDGPIR